jgi:hypothetical protein
MDMEPLEDYRGSEDYGDSASPGYSENEGGGMSGSRGGSENKASTLWAKGTGYGGSAGDRAAAWDMDAWRAAQVATL